MSIARNAEFDSSVSNTLKEKDGVLSDAADATALDSSGSNPQWRFRERLLKKIDRTAFMNSFVLCFLQQQTCHCLLSSYQHHVVHRMDKILYHLFSVFRDILSDFLT